MCTREIKSVMAIVNSAPCKKKALFSSKLKLNLRKKLLNYYIWSIAFYGTESWTTPKEDQKSYVYWTVHHLDSWIKRDQLDVTCFIISLFNAQHVSDVNTSILRSLRLICWVISWVVLLWFDVCWCFSLHTDTTPPQPNHNVTPTHNEPKQYNPWNDSTNKSQSPEDGCINIRNMLSIK